MAPVPEAVNRNHVILCADKDFQVRQYARIQRTELSRAMVHGWRRHGELC